MIIKLKQLSSWDVDHYLPVMNFQYEYVVNDNVEYTASITRNFQEMNGDIRRDNESLIVLNYRFVQGVKPEVLSIYNIKNRDGEEIGKIQPEKVGGLFGGYSYVEMSILDRKYSLYTVGKGKEGTFVCIYKEDVQVAMIERSDRSQDGKDEYSIYLKDKEDIIPACLIALYNDYVNYNDGLGGSKKLARQEYTRTTNKILKSKYDPEFKESVLKLEQDYK